MIFSFDVSDKRGLVHFFYKNDTPTFHEHIHKRGGTIEENVEDTLSSISATSKMYGVNKDGRIAGYFVWHKTEQDELILEGFHVGIEFRNREFLIEFWNIVKEKFNAPFKTGIYCRNEPALRSLLKAGFEFDKWVEYDNKLFIILKYS